MADQLPFLGDGSLAAAVQAIQARPGAVNGVVDAAATGQPPARTMQSFAQGLGQNITAMQHPGAGIGFSNGRPQVTPQQQAQLVQLLRARMAGGGQPPQPPQPGGPAPSAGGVPQMPMQAPSGINPQGLPPGVQ